jgi:hypothetical protein
MLYLLVRRPIARVDQRLPPDNLTPDTTASASADQHPGGDEKAAIAYLEAAKAILRRP